MTDTANSAVNPLSLDLPQLSLRASSFIQIGFFIALAAMTYYLSRRVLKTMGNTGALEKRTLFYRMMNILTFILPGLIFLYGLTSVSRGSLFVSLLFFVILSIVFGFTLIDPAKSILASMIITLRGDLRVGDYITVGNIEGEISSIGALNILIISKKGSRTFIPTHRVLNQAYEVHAKKGGPSITITVPADKISKRNLERLAHLCTFKRKGSDLRVSTMDGQHKLSLEISNREARPWVQKYFDKHLQR